MQNCLLKFRLIEKPDGIFRIYKTISKYTVYYTTNNNIILFNILQLKVKFLPRCKKDGKVPIFLENRLSNVFIVYCLLLLHLFI